MKFIVVDTETSGLPRTWKLPPSMVDNWPRIVTIAWALSLPDQEVKREYHIIKPDGWKSELKSLETHGITHERGMDEGKPIADVLLMLEDDLAKAELIVCHNTQFDLPVIAAELHRLKRRDVLLDHHYICTMKQSTKYCRIPGKYGFKWPSLKELHQKLFGCEPEGMHSSEGDVSTTLKCYLKLVELKVIQ